MKLSIFQDQKVLIWSSCYEKREICKCIPLEWVLRPNILIFFDLFERFEVGSALPLFNGHRKRPEKESGSSKANLHPVCKRWIRSNSVRLILYTDSASICSINAIMIINRIPSIWSHSITECIGVWTSPHWSAQPCNRRALSIQWQLTGQLVWLELSLVETFRIWIQTHFLQSLLQSLKHLPKHLLLNAQRSTAMGISAADSAVSINVKLKSNIRLCITFALFDVNWSRTNSKR